MEFRAVLESLKTCRPVFAGRFNDLTNGRSSIGTEEFLDIDARSGLVLKDREYASLRYSPRGNQHLWRARTARKG